MSKGDLNELALFAGGGGGLLGTKLLGWRTVCYVERDPYTVEILKARIRDGYLDDAPIWDDVCTFDGKPWVGSVDIVSAGFPCPPFSEAGHMLGEKDPRNLWPETCRVIGEVRPSFVLLENVSRLIHFAYFGEIIASLSKMGYRYRWGTFQGENVGSPQHRERVFLVANTNSYGLEANAYDPKYAAQPQIQTRSAWWQRQLSYANDGTLWRIPNFEFFGMVDGYPNWMDRIRTIGNMQIPAVVRAAWDALS